MANFSQPAREYLKSIPYIALDPKESSTTRHTAVAFCVATCGINAPGTIYRMDDVPILLRPAFDFPFPSDLEILSGIEKRVKELKTAANGLPTRRASLRPTHV
jgi:formylmethanofuran dehydrogenase subunit B